MPYASHRTPSKAEIQIFAAKQPRCCSPPVAGCQDLTGQASFFIHGHVFYSEDLKPAGIREVCGVVSFPSSLFVS